MIKNAQKIREMSFCELLEFQRQNCTYEGVQFSRMAGQHIADKYPEFFPHIIDILEGADQEAIMHLLTAIAYKQDYRLAGPLKKLLRSDGLMAFNRRLAAIMLFILGEEEGREELRRMVVSDRYPDDVRIKTLEIICAYRLRIIFDEHESVILDELIGDIYVEGLWRVKKSN